MFGKRATVGTCVLLFVLGACPTPRLLAQSEGDRGREFWVGFLYSLSEHLPGGPEVSVLLTAETVTNVTVEYPAHAPTFRRMVVVTPGESVTVVLPQAASAGWGEWGAQGHGVHLVGDQPFTTVLANLTHASSDAALGIPASQLGREYFVAGQSTMEIGGSEVLVVASQDDTTVTITPKPGLRRHGTGGLFEIHLDAGEGCRAFVEAGPADTDDATGSHVLADKPIFVANGHLFANVPFYRATADHLFEVALPVPTWGTEFILATAPGRTRGTQFRVLAARDDTRLLLNGDPVGELLRGSFRVLHSRGPGPHLLEASEPVAVVQYVTGIQDWGATGEGDPAMGNVVPPAQFRSSYSFTTVEGPQFGEHYLLLTVANPDVTSVRLDGELVDRALFSRVPGSDWSVATVPVSEGFHQTATPRPHGVQVLGYEYADSYLFPAGMLLADLSCSVLASTRDATICEGDVVLLDAADLRIRDCPGAVSLVWRDDTGAIVGTDPVLMTSPAETTDYELTATCVDDPSCSSSETVTVMVHAVPTFEPPVVSDVSDCQPSLRLSWTEATFQTAAGGVYNVYRSAGPAASCAAALAAAPVVSGLSATNWTDAETENGVQYVYVVEAEDAEWPSGCNPAGPTLGGAVTRHCRPSIVDEFVGPIPEEIGAVLRVRHDEQEVELRWDAARDLLVDESFLVRKAFADAGDLFRPVTEYGNAERSHVELDLSAPLQFFELRVVEGCGTLSPDEYPGAP